MPPAKLTGRHTGARGYVTGHYKGVEEKHQRTNKLMQFENQAMESIQPMVSSRSMAGMSGTTRLSRLADPTSTLTSF